MDQYPTEEEELELQYDEDLEMIPNNDKITNRIDVPQPKGALRTTALTEEEEFELRYQDEFEMLEDNVKTTNKRHLQPSTSKAITQNYLTAEEEFELEYLNEPKTLDNGPLSRREEPSTSKAANQNMDSSAEEEFELRYEDDMEIVDNEPMIVEHPQPSTSKVISENRSLLQSPQLSQISHDGTTINRRLFGTPNQQKRISSTPLQNSDNYEELRPLGDPLTEIQNTGLSRKRRLKDLFGDIRDIPDYDETYVDPEAKKQKCEEERDMELIEKILEARKNFHENLKPTKGNQIDRLNALHEFKKRNLSRIVPKWPFLRLSGWNNERIYIRFHSEEYETKEINEIHLFNEGYSNLLGDSKQGVWDSARELVLKRTQIREANISSLAPNNRGALAMDENLWVEKYKPKKYIDLLSDESTNRSLLYWLRMWDKIVFGNEFKPAIHKPSALNTFNRGSGRFESNGGWKNRRTKQMLNTDQDSYGRPVQKVALLCGPPGLGKTTLAHTIAHHAGYNVCEINASDDRSPEAFRLTLENGTQMTSVLNKDKKPNCIILDEIDGAPQQSIDFLVKFVNDNVIHKAKKGSNKVQKQILKRPILCICNDMYAPALRQLRQIAFVVNFPPIETSRLAERLFDISYEERLKTDLSTLLALAEKSGNDVRSCISMMQFFNAMKKRLTLEDVLKNSFGQKDRHRGLFGVWTAIFQIQRPKKTLTDTDKSNENRQLVTMTDMSLGSRAQNILEVVHMGGDYERLMQGVYENYLSQRMPDPNLDGVVEAMQWFCFSDQIQRAVNHTQNYTIYPYLQFGFVIWHLLFASLAWPRITFPSKGFEFNQKSTTHKMILNSFRKGINSKVNGIGQGSSLLIETIPILKRILAPQLRAVSQQLLNPREQYDFRHTIEVMADLGLMFTQIKSLEGTYKYQMEPNLDIIFEFKGIPNPILNYFGRQMIGKEIELELMKRSAPKLTERNTKKINKVQEKNKSPENIPNHLQTLKPRINRQKNTKELIHKDFFGRLSTKETMLTVKEGGTDDIVKSPIWFKYKEGYTNAVRKDIFVNDLV